ncbi:uncharacterized protein LOC144246642 [Lonchura striata]
MCPSSGLAAGGGAALRARGVLASSLCRVPPGPPALGSRRERLPALSTLPGSLGTSRGRSSDQSRDRPAEPRCPAGPAPAVTSHRVPFRRDEGCVLEKGEFCSTHGVVKKLQHLQEGPAARVPHLPGAQEATWHEQGGAICECEDVENGFCSSGEWFSSHPVLTAVLILLLLVLVLALGVALAVQSAPQVPVTPEILQCCPHGWVVYNGVCYYLSKDYRSWDQAQERCSELGASLAILQDEAMDLLFRLRGNVDYWIGLRRRGERLHWGDGSSYSSRVPVLGNSPCVYLADDKFRSENCSNERPYVCSKAQAAL